MTNYYIYYRIDLKRVDEVRIAVREIFSSVKSKTGIQGRWMRRRDEPSTYMEVYEGVKDGAAFEALMQSEAARFGVPRRLEIFSPVERPS